ncbi:hypothetical protein QJS66_11605 [Kocuria rhizophila]|nr:hypothetical protein QJS66_11605 [Kocuria rhizophila]
MERVRGGAGLIVTGGVSPTGRVPPARAGRTLRSRGCPHRTVTDAVHAGGWPDQPCS